IHHFDEEFVNIKLLLVILYWFDFNILEVAAYTDHRPLPRRWGHARSDLAMCMTFTLPFRLTSVTLVLVQGCRSPHRPHHSTVGHEPGPGDVHDIYLLPCELTFVTLVPGLLTQTTPLDGGACALTWPMCMTFTLPSGLTSVTLVLVQGCSHRPHHSTVGHEALTWRCA
ncbi:hypothetical protein RRG08_066337, partial [Elysia crispata]